MWQLILTLAVGAAVGFLFSKLKVPGGMMVGALVGVTVLNIGTGLASMPSTARMVAQITAGAFIGTTVEKSDLKRLPHLLKPVCILMSGMFLLNVVMGVVIHTMSGVDWLTAFFCAVPGGMSDTPIIAADMGANAGAVAVAQFMRLVAGIGLFPSIILAVTRKEPVPQRGFSVRQVSKRTDASSVLLTAAVATVAGVLGKLSGIPVGTLLFAMVSVIMLKLLLGWAAIPMWMKRVAQILSGSYIGVSLGLDKLVEMKALIIPFLLLVVAYAINSFVVGGLLHRCCGFTRREAMLIATQAGASDMALISGDLDIDNPDLIVLQIIRMVLVISIFPQIIHIIVSAL